MGGKGRGPVTPSLRQEGEAGGVVLSAIKEETLDRAFAILNERLDPVVDVFEAAGTFRQLVWPVNEPVHDFFARYLEQGIRAGLNSKQSCILMTTQLPVEVRQPAKEWIQSKGEEFTELEGTLFAVKVRELFLGKGISLTQGYLDRGSERVAQVKSALESRSSFDLSEPNSPTDTEKVQFVGK